MTTRALIGYSGFVGSNLLQQASFDGCYNSRNVQELRGKSYDLIVCAGIQAKKWWANGNPEEDWQNIQKLLDVLATVDAKRFVLISTVDVYPIPKNVDEDTPIEPSSNHAYGKNRFRAEEFIREKFVDHLVLRLPGLFGNGIKKNVIHDLLQDHELEKINPLGVFQYYYLGHLWSDIEKSQKEGLALLNLSTEAVSTKEIRNRFFPDKKLGKEESFAANYDMRSAYAALWNSEVPGYLYSRSRILEDMSAFISKYLRY